MSTKEKKSVMQVCLSSSEGGLELNCFRVAKYFHDEGYFSIMVTTPGSILEKKCKDAGIKTYTMKGKKYFAPSIVGQLKKIVKEHNVEIIFSHYLKDLWHLFWVKRSFPNVKLYGVSQMLVEYPKKDFFHKLIYSKLDKMIVLTNIQKNSLLETLPIPAEKYAIIPNGVDTEIFKPMEKDSPEIIAFRKSLGVKPNEILVGMIGRFDRQKGQLELMDAIPNLKNKFPNVKYLFLGSDTLGEESIQKIILDKILTHKLETHVQVRGFTDNVSKVMNALDIFVMPSYKETFGIVLIEAMALEKICLATNVGGPVEILDKGDCGLLIEPKSSKAIENGISEIVTNLKKYEDKAKRAKQRVHQKYRAKDVLQKLKELTL